MEEVVLANNFVDRFAGLSKVQGCKGDWKYRVRRKRITRRVARERDVGVFVDEETGAGQPLFWLDWTLVLYCLNKDPKLQLVRQSQKQRLLIVRLIRSRLGIRPGHFLLIKIS